MNIWLLIIIAGLITYAFRLSFIIIFGQTEIPKSVRKALHFVPTAVMTAIIFPELFLHNGALDISPGNTRLIAGMLAAVVAWRTKNVVLTILVGMGVLLALQWLMV